MKPPERPKGDPRLLVPRFVKPGQTVVDVGAGVGELTALMLTAVGPTGTVIAVEPDPRKVGYFDKLMLNYPAHTLRLETCAAGASVEGRVLQRAGSTAASLWHGGEKRCPDREVEVSVTPLDRLVTRADLVKIDTQGSEAHILDGAWSLLQTCPIWILELWEWGLQTAGRTANDVIERLRFHGLTPYWCDDTPIDAAGMADFYARSRENGAGFFRNIYAIRWVH